MLRLTQNASHIEISAPTPQKESLNLIGVWLNLSQTKKKAQRPCEPLGFFRNLHHLYTVQLFLRRSTLGHLLSEVLHQSDALDAFELSRLQG
jgi:hypothetical protein